MRRRMREAALDCSCGKLATVSLFLKDKKRRQIFAFKGREAIERGAYA